MNYYRAGQAMSHVRHYLLAAIRAYPWRPNAFFGLGFSIFGRRGMRLFLDMHGILAARLKKRRDMPEVLKTAGGKIKSIIKFMRVAISLRECMIINEIKRGK